jgi:hypothetical protein
MCLANNKKKGKNANQILFLVQQFSEYQRHIFMILTFHSTTYESCYEAGIDEKISTKLRHFDSRVGALEVLTAMYVLKIRRDKQNLL